MAVISRFAGNIYNLLYVYILYINNFESKIAIDIVIKIRDLKMFYILKEIYYLTYFC